MDKAIEEKMEQKYLKAKLDTSPLWKQAAKVGETFYGLAEELPEEEKFIMSSRLRSLSFNLTADLAESLGSIDPNNRCYYMGTARRDIFGLKNAYRFATRQQFIDLDPKLMLELDSILEQIEKEIEEAQNDMAIAKGVKG